MSDQQPPQEPQDPSAGGVPPTPPPVPPVPPATPPAQPYGQPYGQPAAQPPAPQGSYAYNPGYGGGVPQTPMPQTNNNAIVAFVLSLVAWFVCPIIAAIVALVFASKAGKEIRSSNGWQTGSGFVTAAKIISWINIGVSIIVLIIYILLFIAIAANPGISPTDTPFPTFTNY